MNTLEDAPPGLILLFLLVLATVASAVAHVRIRHPEDAVERIGSSRDAHGAPVWICRSRRSRRVFLVPAAADLRPKRRRTWTAGSQEEEEGLTRPVGKKRSNVG